jgi:hypothetical protein
MKEGQLVRTDSWDAALENGCALGGANDRGGGVPATATKQSGDHSGKQDESGTAREKLTAREAIGEMRSRRGLGLGA